MNMMIGVVKLQNGFKHVTDGYSYNSKQLFLYGEHYNEFKAFIKQMMGNLF